MKHINYKSGQIYQYIFTLLTYFIIHKDKRIKVNIFYGVKLETKTEILY
jgi:hypothetical protein